ncbi:MAG: hypothetical protein IJA52_06975 [Clostridia bacterium]|nr:hypothetical protein [Clostridia bacterium]
MNMDNTIHFRYNKSLSNDVTVYLDAEKIDISQVQNCGSLIHLTVIQNKTNYYNGSFCDYIISLFDRSNDHFISDILPPYGIIYECDIETGAETVVDIKLHNGYSSKLSLNVDGGMISNEKKCEVISDNAVSLFNKIFILYMILINLPVLICTVLCFELWWIPVALFGAVIIPFDIMLIRYKIKSMRIKKNNSHN